MQTPILECRDLSISFRTRRGIVPAVVNFNLTVMPGEAVGLVGESGCGKSTVALAIMRHLGRNGFISGGSIHFMGRDITALSPAELRAIRGSEIAMVYQEPMASLNPSLRIADQLSEVLEEHGNRTRMEALLKVRDMLSKVRLPDPDRILNAFPHQLSGGQQQRVLIAMALLANPRLLLLDEPTTALDVTVEAGLVELIREIAAEFGTSMIYISHNLGLIRETCQRVTVMYSGRAVEEGPVDALFSNMAHPYTRGLFNSIPLPWEGRENRKLMHIRGQLPLPHERPVGCFFGPRCDHFQSGLCDRQPAMTTVEPMSGHRVLCARHPVTPISRTNRPAASATVNDAEVMVEAINLSKHYPLPGPGLGQFSTAPARVIRANESIDLTVRKGETVAVVGESGCGKSTFAKMLIGLETASGGTLSVKGKDVSRLPVKKRGRDLIRTLQIVFQNPFDTLNPSRTIGQQIARVIRRFGAEKNETLVAERLDQMLDAVKLPREFANRMPRQLSGGQKQRVGIARAFASGAEIIVADEPVSALDVSVQAAVIELLLELQKDKHTSMIFISHDLSVVRYIADRVVVMYLGRIMEQGTVEQVFNPPYHPYTEALLSAVPVASADIEKTHIVLSGDLPSPINPPKGCPFSTRCPRKLGSICDETLPETVSLRQDHKIACHIPESDLMSVAPVFRRPPAVV